MPDYAYRDVLLVERYVTLPEPGDSCWRLLSYRGDDEDGGVYWDLYRAQWYRGVDGAVKQEPWVHVCCGEGVVDLDTAVDAAENLGTYLG